MKYLTTIIIILTFNFCTNTSRNDFNLNEFNRFLGEKKAEVLNQAVESFELFLIANYPNEKSEKARLETFLYELSTAELSKRNLIFDTITIKNLLNQFETTGLRKEIVIYNYEREEYRKKNKILSDNSVRLTEEVIPIQFKDSIEKKLFEKELESQDSLLETNLLGKYYRGLQKFGMNDPFIMKYLENKQLAGQSSLTLEAGGFLFYCPVVSRPIYKRMMVSDFYYYLMSWKMDKKKKYGSS